MAIQNKKYVSPVANEMALQNALDGSVAVSNNGFACVSVSWDDAIVDEVAVDQQMMLQGFTPAPVNTGDSFFILESPDTSRWDFMLDDSGAITIKKEGTTIAKPVSPVAQYAALGADMVTSSNVFVTLLTLGPFNTGGGPLLIQATVGISPLIAVGVANVEITLDGVQVDARQLNFIGLGSTQPATLLAVVPAAVGAHTVLLRWRTIGVLSQIQCRPISNPNDETARISVVELAA